MAEQMQCDVAIVGLGPTGAVLANILGQYGWSVIGIERDEDLYYAPRAVHFDDEIMRIFQWCGLAQEIGASSEPFTQMQFRLRPGGKPVLQMPIGSQDRRYGHPGAWWFHQPTLERHFHDGLKRFSKVTALYGTTVRAVTQDEQAATIVAQNRHGEISIRARYVVGCDGGRSFVRREAGLPLDSADFDEAWVVVDTITRSGAKHPDLPRDHQQTCNPRQPVTYVPLAGPYYEFQFMVMGGKSEREATDPAFVRRQLRDFVDLDTIEITRIAYYKFHALWAGRWRERRIILAGDSAHQMPPFLGQGMCSGIRDAHGLGWRLDLVLNGSAAPALLDDYETERSWHVQHIIRGAMLLGRVIQTRSRWVALLRNRLMFAPARLIPPFRRLVYSLANRKRPLAVGCLGRNHRRLAGQIALQPLVSRADGAPLLLDQALGQDFALLACKGAIDRARPALRTLQQRLPLELVEFDTKPSPGCVGDPDGTLARWFDCHGIDYMLIRPDRYIFDAGRADSFDRVAADLASRLHASNVYSLSLAAAA
jgi:3-(3-hydroxy-phenyl)propionate hydroxylase